MQGMYATFVNLQEEAKERTSKRKRGFKREAEDGVKKARRSQRAGKKLTEKRRRLQGKSIAEAAAQVFLVLENFLF